MKIDFADALIGGVTGALGGFLVFFGAIWTALTTAEFALAVGDYLHDGTFDCTMVERLATHPEAMILAWILPGLIAMAATLLRFGRIDGSGAIRWGVFVALLSLWPVGVRHGDISSADWLPKAAVWAVWSTAIVMIGTGLWFLRYWQINRWAAELTMLRAENAVRRTAMEEAGVTGLKDDGPSL
jgi:hypothetical protein